MGERHHVVEFWGDPSTWNFRGEDDTEYIVVTKTELARLGAIEAAAREYDEATRKYHNFEVGISASIKAYDKLRQALAAPKEQKEGE